MFSPTRAVFFVGVALLLVHLAACSSRVAGPNDRCEPSESPQTLTLSASMCAGAPASSASAAPDGPAPPAPPPDASAEAGAPAAPPSRPAETPLADPATCEIDCARACGGVPDARCKRLSEKEVECRIARPGRPGC